MIEYNRQMIEIDEETAVGFIVHGEKYFEYWAPFFSVDFPELTDEDFQKIIDWAEESATMIHRTEYEYEFSIPYWDNKYLAEKEVPDGIKPIFQAMFIRGKRMNKDRTDSYKVIPCLKIWFPATQEKNQPTMTIEAENDKGEQNAS